jgi:hypothetical protein
MLMEINYSKLQIDNTIIHQQTSEVAVVFDHNTAGLMKLSVFV